MKLNVEQMVAAIVEKIQQPVTAQSSAHAVKTIKTMNRCEINSCWVPGIKG
jgi:hypothetical protein